MSPETRAILEAADCEVGWEVPRNDYQSLPWKSYRSEISAVQAWANTELGLKLELDGSVQDASFFEQLLARNTTTYLSVRFSNFGKLYTISTYGVFESDEQETFRTEDLKAIIDSFGWVLVSAEDLNSPYDGKHRDFVGMKASWWLRFFDYV
jgi:hypothetical protein